MRIGIDARLYAQTGVGRYIKNLLAMLEIIDRENDYTVYLRKEEYASYKPLNFRFKKKLLNIPWHSVKEQYAVPMILLKDNLDVVHFPYFNIPVLYPKKYLLTVHDLIVDNFDTGRASTLPYGLYKAKRVAYQAVTTLGIKRASKISVISGSTKNEVCDHYHIRPSKITVTYDALDSSFARLLKTHKSRRLVKGKYFLYVGNAYPHKNLERLIDAFELVLKDTECKLVLAGDDKFFYPRLESLVRVRKLERSVIFIGQADDKQLINLYSFASCLVFPSLMEGFGLPNLEALSCGCLPVISDIPVFREIWKTKLPLFNPDSPQSMARALSEVMKMPKGKYSEKINSAVKSVKKYSWLDTTRKTLELYQTIANS
jgi:glycosyltransferase involved in cell wall biosynthesis